jgi:hypothetical protein
MTLPAHPIRPAADPIQVELFGCSSSGKSSLAPRLLRSARALGVEATLSEDLVLRQVGLEGLRPGWLRTLCVDLLAAAACLATWREHRAFLRLVVATLRGLPARVPWPQRLNMARNVIKKTGVRALVRRRAGPGELVVLDEGTLQTAHYLFVQACTEPDPARIDAFLARVPLPDVAVYVREDESTLVRRTVARGHKRLSDRSSDSVARFVRRAVFTLERVADAPPVQERLLVLDRSDAAISDPPPAAGPAGQCVREVLRRATGAVRAVPAPALGSAGAAS